jgi:hypothetical protein
MCKKQSTRSGLSGLVKLAVNTAIAPRLGQIKHVFQYVHFHHTLER